MHTKHFYIILGEPFYNSGQETEHVLYYIQLL